MSKAIRNYTINSAIDGSRITLRLTRRDGAVFGFTDHDRDLAFDGTGFDWRNVAGFARLELALYGDPLA